MKGRPSLRERQAGLTRTAILEAARTLFDERGYANTSVRVLAGEAGVAVQTVYAAFGSKAGVLLGLLDAMDRATVEPIATRLARAEDPREMVALAAALERHVRETGAGLLGLVAQAAATDPEVARVWEQGFQRHREGIARLCARLAEGGHLRDGLMSEEATATALALTSVEAYEELLRRRGWSHDRYEEWLAHELRHALLSPGGSR